MANGKINEGLIYCVKNPLFPHLVKIGKTTAPTLEDRGLDASNIPENFEKVFVHKVRDIDATEEAVHNVVEEFRYKSKSRRSTEFFYACAEEMAKKCVLPFSIDDQTLEFEFEPGPDDTTDGEIKFSYRDDDLVSWEDLRLMRSENDKFRTEQYAKSGWVRATNPWRMNIVKAAKKAGAWKDTRLSLSWLKETGYFDILMKIDWDSY